MSEERFRELVNLHLDGEISKDEKAELQNELQSNHMRRQDFEARCRLQRAMRFALLTPDERLELEASARRMKVSSRRCYMKASLLTFGLAASVVVSAGGFIAYCLLQTEQYTDGHVFSHALSDDEMDLRLAGLSGEVTAKSKDVRCSVVAQLRLLGLTPGMIDDEPRLRSVDLAAQAEARQARMREIERLNEPSTYMAMPQPVLFNQGSARSSNSMATGFDVSLVSYK